MYSARFIKAIEIYHYLCYVIEAVTCGLKERLSKTIHHKCKSNKCSINIYVIAWRKSFTLLLRNTFHTL